MPRILTRRKKIKRLREITEVAARHGLGFYLEKFQINRIIGKSLGKDSIKIEKVELAAKKLRLLLEDLGPTYIKIGQLLSIRPDLVPPEVIFELEKLQDNVSPFDYEIVEKIIKNEFEKNISDIFSKFEKLPLASASIGQVHEAYLHDGTHVVVKIQRPEAREIITADMDLIKTVARLIKARIEFVDIEGVVDEFIKSLNRELDYRTEAKHIDRFRFNFRQDELVKIPLVYWPYTSKRVLTMEYIDGTKISDLATPEALGIDTFKLAKFGAEAFMKQVLVDGFFHGDLHPANLLITPEGKIGYLDFGIIGEISEKDREYVTYLLASIIRKDIEGVVNYSRKLGVEIDQAQVSSIKTGLKNIIDRYYGRELGDIKIDVIGREFLNLIYQNKMKIPKRFALLVKALITVEGVAQDLYPGFNVMEVAKPYALNLIKEKYSLMKNLEDFTEHFYQNILLLTKFPELIYSVLNKMESGEIELISQNGSRTRQVQKSKNISNLYLTIITIAFIISSALIISFSDFLVIGLIFLGFGIFVILVLIFQILIGKD